MEVKILGTGGGMGLGQPTTALLVGEAVLVDAGSGVESMNLEEAVGVRRVYLSHAHADHLSALPLLVETLFDSDPDGQLEVFALPEVIETLRNHIFNGEIWPDFEVIPSADRGFLSFQEVRFGEVMSDPSGIAITPFETFHEVASCGYVFEFQSGKKFVFTGDTGFSDDLVTVLNGIGKIDVLLTECSFPNREAKKAEEYDHLTPRGVEKLLSGLDVRPGEVLLGHLKPAVQKEIARDLGEMNLTLSSSGMRREL